MISWSRQIATLRRRRQSRKGQTLTEFALITVLVAIIFVAVFSLLIGSVNVIFGNLTRILDTSGVF